MRQTGYCAVLVLAALLLGGCAGLISEPREPDHLHDLGPVDERRADAPALRIERIHAPTWLDTDRIYYRQMEADPTRLRHYAQNRWIATPAELIGERLSTAFPDPGERGGLTLRGELVTFEQRFEDEDTSEAVLRMRAVLARDGRTLDQRSFAFREPARTGVSGAVSAFARAAEDLEAALAEWAAEVGR